MQAIQTYRNILIEQERAVAVVTMNRPQRRNALSHEHLEELIDCFKTIGSERQLAAVVAVARQRPGLLRRPRSERDDRPRP